MQPIGKSFSSRAIQNLLVSFEGIKCETKIDDTPRQVTEHHYCQSIPTSRKNPHLAGLSHRLAVALGYDPEELLADANTPLYLSGSKIIPGSVPIAHNYCGYQFGVWAGQLGDGRAHTLGHVQNGTINELQLKGSGLSPFSRHADGNSVVSSAVREFLASELMHSLGVPTTRALSLVISEDIVVRDPMYNGIIKKQNAAIVMRVAETFIRFGSFQVTNKTANMYSPNQMNNRNTLLALADYLLQNIHKQIDPEEGDPYEQLFIKMVVKSAEMVAHWQSIGFVHGVLNTDNMSMAGVTLDYGPFGFIDYFSRDYVSNATDEYQRYSYRSQPSVVKWNLQRLAEAMDYLVPVKILKKHIDEKYDSTFTQLYNNKMAKKLGLPDNNETTRLVEQLLDVMHSCGSNFTNTFRILAGQQSCEKMVDRLLMESLPSEYFKRSIRVIAHNNIDQEVMDRIFQEDPGFNKAFLAQQQNRKAMLNQLYSESCEQRTSREKALWTLWLNNYNSMNPDKQSQKSSTIHYVLLNQVAKNITEQLVSMQPAGQRKLLNQVLDVLAQPYIFNEWFQEKYWKKRPVPVRLTCSS